MTIPFEPTRSYVYRAARYELLPKIVEIVRKYGNEPFLLREITKQVLEETYTPEQLEVRIKKQESDATDKIRNIFGFYIPFLAENLRVFERVGSGMFKNISFDEELAEADAVATDIESDDSGIIYAYSFPLIKKPDGRFPIKIGLTVTGDAQARVSQQCKQTCCFENPSFLKLGKFAGLLLLKLQFTQHWRRVAQSVSRREQNGSILQSRKSTPSLSLFSSLHEGAALPRGGGIKAKFQGSHRGNPVCEAAW